MTDGPPDTTPRRRRLFSAGSARRSGRSSSWPRRTREGEPRAPIHLIFYDRCEQRLLLEGLARHFDRDPRRHAALRLPDPDRRLRLADRHLPRPGDPRAEELPDGLPVAPGGRAYLSSTGIAGTVPRPLPRPALRPRGKLDDEDDEALALVHRPGALQQPDPAGIRLRRLGRARAPGRATRPTSSALPRASPRHSARLPGPPAGGDGARSPRRSGQPADGEDALRPARARRLRRRRRGPARRRSTSSSRSSGTSISARGRRRGSPRPSGAC